jgi:hypothetical protein
MSIGKLVDGLIHNLNGPLHSLGIEMDMMHHLFLKDAEPSQELVDTITTRLKRMDQEFESLNRLIRVTAARVDLLKNLSEYLHLNSFLLQELEFLQSNLYFKHNVETSLDLARELPALKNTRKDLGLALAWFMQGLVEELERQELRHLRVETQNREPEQLIRFCMSGTPSQTFTDVIASGENALRNLDSNTNELFMPLALATFCSGGVATQTEFRPSESTLTLVFRNAQSS